MTPRFFIQRSGQWVQVSAEEYAAHRAASVPSGSSSVPSVAKSPKGLGDLVHAMAHPIAKAIDHVAGTNLQNCGGCAQRRKWLNGLSNPQSAIRNPQSP